MARKSEQTMRNLGIAAGRPKSFFTLSELPEVKLPGWPTAFAGHLELKKNWAKAEAEAQHHLKEILSFKMYSPYPILSYSLSDAVISGTKLQLCYLLFPTLSPLKLTHALT